MPGIAHNHPHDTIKVLIVQTGEIMNRQTIFAHPEIAPGGPISPTPAGDSNTAELVGVRGGEYRILHADTARARGMGEVRVVGTF